MGRSYHGERGVPKRRVSNDEDDDVFDWRQALDQKKEEDAIKAEVEKELAEKKKEMEDDDQED